MATDIDAARGSHVSGRVAMVWLCAVLSLATIWVLGVLVPYFVNDLDRLPLADLASGAHDPKDMWPYSDGNRTVSLLRALVLLLAIPLLPLLALASVVVGAAILTRQRGSLTTTARRATQAVVALALIVMTLTLSPLGLALGRWALD
jgi:uncharacterized membrane protein YjgN (DUF898 family)